MTAEGRNDGGKSEGTTDWDCGGTEERSDYCIDGLTFSLRTYYSRRKYYFLHPLLFNLVFLYGVVVEQNKRRSGWQLVCAAMSSSRHVSVAPATPTQSCRSTPASHGTPKQKVVGRRPLNPLQFSWKQPLRDDRIFGPFRIALREAVTLVSFVYKAERCQGKLAPIP